MTRFKSNVFESIIFGSGMALIFIIIFLLNWDLNLLPSGSWSLIQLIIIAQIITISAFYYQKFTNIRIIFFISLATVLLSLFFLYLSYFFGLFALAAFSLKPNYYILLTSLAFFIIFESFFLIWSKWLKLSMLKVFGLPVSLLFTIAVTLYSRPKILNFHENNIFDFIAFFTFYILSTLILIILMFSVIHKEKRSLDDHS